MTIHTGRLQAELATEFGAANNENVTASLLPLIGPSYHDLVANRLEFLAGERVMPVALAVGKLVFGDNVQGLIGRELEKNSYEQLVEKDLDAQNLGWVFGDQAMNVALILSQFRRASMLDAYRRGVREPEVVLAATFGGIDDGTWYSEKPHIDNKVSRIADLRYSLTALGLLTGFNLKGISLEDLGSSIYFNEHSPLDYIAPTEMVGLEALVTMFELHTPHYKPVGNGLPRLYSTLNIRERSL